MAFADLALADFNWIADGDLGEAVEYQANLPSGTQSWKRIMAVVQRGDASNSLELGLMGRRGPDPIMVMIAKDATTGIAQVTERVDLVKLNPGTSSERIYNVVAVLDEGDPAVWRLYATP